MDDTKNKCRELLKNFSGLEPKEKSNCITLFFSLIEENKEEAKQLYFDFEHLFDSIPELGLVKQELEDACGGELKNPEVTSELSKSFWEIFKSFFENFFTKKRNTNAEVNEYEKNKPSKHFNRIEVVQPEQDKN